MRRQEPNDLSNYELRYNLVVPYTGEGMTADRLGLSLVYLYDSERVPSKAPPSAGPRTTS